MTPLPSELVAALRDGGFEELTERPRFRVWLRHAPVRLLTALLTFPGTHLRA
jgi:hypothetical protein